MKWHLYSIEGEIKILAETREEAEEQIDLAVAQWLYPAAFLDLDKPLPFANAKIYYAPQHMIRFIGEPSYDIKVKNTKQKSFRPISIWDRIKLWFSVQTR